MKATNTMRSSEQPEVEPRAQQSASALAGRSGPAEALSVRAENVLKILAVELMGETPPQGKWTPPERLLEKLTYRHLSIARNCGPRTTAEIIRWAQARGKTIKRLPLAGRSLSALWGDTIAKFSTGEISKAEIVTALETSTRRRNTQIPVALQQILLQIISSSGG